VFVVFNNLLQRRNDVSGDLNVAIALAKQDASGVLYGNPSQVCDIYDSRKSSCYVRLDAWPVAYFSAFSSAQIDSWVDYAVTKITGSDVAKLMTLTEDLSNHLQMRSFFVGYCLTAADLVLFAAILCA
jgi:hypothetical protein